MTCEAVGSARLPARFFRRGLRCAPWLLIALGGGACSTGSPIGGTSTSVQHRGSASGTPGAAGSAGSGSGTGGASSSSGSTTAAGPDSGCAPGQAQFTSTTDDLCGALQNQMFAGHPAIGVAVTTEPSFGPAVFSDQNGQFSLCVDEGVTFATFFDAGSAYAPMQLELQNLTSNQIFLAGFGGVTLICPSVLQVLQGKLQSYDPAEASVVIGVTSISNEAQCQRQGWVVTATLPDGGAPSTPWPLVYIDYTGGVYTAGTTLGDGLAFVYNIDPSISSLRVSAQSIDAGFGCAPVPNSGLTGLIDVTPQFFGFYPIVVP